MSRPRDPNDRHVDDVLGRLDDVPETDPLTDALRGLRPTPVRLDRDRILFEAGRAAGLAERRANGPRLWPALTAALALIAIGEAVVLTQRIEFHGNLDQTEMTGEPQQAGREPDIETNSRTETNLVGIDEASPDPRQSLENDPVPPLAEVIVFHDRGSDATGLADRARNAPWPLLSETRSDSEDADAWRPADLRRLIARQGLDALPETGSSILSTTPLARDGAASPTVSTLMRAEIIRFRNQFEGESL